MGQRHLRLWPNDFSFLNLILTSYQRFQTCIINLALTHPANS
jgi:hypothetical protein